MVMVTGREITITITYSVGNYDTPWSVVVTARCTPETRWITMGASSSKRRCGVEACRCAPASGSAEARPTEHDTVHLHTPGRQRPLATAVKHQRLS